MMQYNAKQQTTAASIQKGLEYYKKKQDQGDKVSRADNGERNVAEGCFRKPERKSERKRLRMGVFFCPVHKESVRAMNA